MAQNSRHGCIPPTVNDLEIIHPIPEMAPPLLGEEEGPPTRKELNPGAIHAISLSHYG
jgi:hypothetical protein